MAGYGNMNLPMNYSFQRDRMKQMMARETPEDVQARVDKLKTDLETPAPPEAMAQLGLLTKKKKAKPTAPASTILTK